MGHIFSQTIFVNRAKVGQLVIPPYHFCYRASMCSNVCFVLFCFVLLGLIEF
jgi:hypothetical protein